MECHQGAGTAPSPFKVARGQQLDQEQQRPSQLYPPFLLRGDSLWQERRQVGWGGGVEEVLGRVQHLRVLVVHAFELPGQQHSLVHHCPPLPLAGHGALALVRCE